MNSLSLLPQPRRLEQLSGNYALEPGKRIVIEGAPAQELLFTAQRLQNALERFWGVNWTIAAAACGSREEIGAVLRVSSEDRLSKEAHDLTIDERGIRVAAGSVHGLFNGVSTLVQLLDPFNLASPQLPFIHISDAPDYANRGVMLDISRDKVPTMQTLYELVDLLASWKVNQLQLYMEHTFAYRNHPDVWKNASPLTEQEVLELDAYCQARFVELVPNQNSFGHMNRWLKHERYRDLAECPDGYEGLPMWGSDPFSLNPLEPRTIKFLCGLYDELLPNFSSRQFNVGCDETFDLGLGRSKDEVEKRGTGAVYLEFLKKIHAEVRARGHGMQFWGDVILQYPEAVRDLPRDGLALIWGYEADYPFDEQAAYLEQVGVPFYVCPGTSSWNSIAARVENAVANIRNAAESGLGHKAEGLLVTDWGDNGHWQYLPFSYAGLAYAAAVGWCLEANRELDLAAGLDRFAFRDKAAVMGNVTSKLGTAYRQLGVEMFNSSALFEILRMRLEDIRGISGLTPEALRLTGKAVEEALEPLDQAQLQRKDGKLIQEEFQTAGRLIQHAVSRGLLAFEDDPRRAARAKRKLAADLERILRKHEKLWLARNRPGGMKDSLALMRRIGEAYTFTA